MDNKTILELNNTSWSEKVYIETTEHIICGFVYMPKIGKKTRLLSDILNSNKTFLAVKNCSLEYKLNSSKNIEHHEFLELNISSILIMRPINE